MNKLNAKIIFFLEGNNINRIIIWLYVFAVTSWILRMVFPGMKYIFIPLFVVSIFSFCVYYNKMFFNKNVLYEFLKTLYPLIILGIFYIIGMIISFKSYRICYNEMIEFSINVISLYLLFLLIHGNKSVIYLKQVFKKITIVISLTSLLAALLGITNYILQFHYKEIFIGSIGTNLNMDANFYALYSFLGIFSLFSLFSKQLSIIKRYILQIAILLLIINIFFTFSARSLLLLGILISLFIIIQISVIKKEEIRLLKKNTRFLTFTLIFSLLFMFISVKQNSLVYKHVKNGYIKNQTIAAENEKDIRNFLLNEAFNVEKMQYAFEIFKRQNISQIFFGSGFIYLEKYGKKFNNNFNIYDYPHNLILSSLLYSGLLGSLFVVVFLFVSLYYGIIYIKKYPSFSVMLIISSIFILFGGNSIFSVPIFLFLFSLSFLIRHQEISDLHINYNLAKPGSKLFKEIFDYSISTIFLILLFPLLFIVSIMVFSSMGWPIFYKQIRVGQNGKLFFLYKYRTMKKASSKTSIAAKEIERITKLGKILRRTKIDELPELINIIRGDMSFVGPRPDVPGYADLLDESDKIILQLKPGLTGPASLKYVDEEEILKNVSNSQEYNDKVIFPDKVRINKEYMRYWNFWIDIKIIIFTALRKKLTEEYFQ